MKKLLIILLLFSGYAQAQQIQYTPMSAAGYRYKYLLADSGFNLPYGDTLIKRGDTRAGSLICRIADKLVYRYDGTRWELLGGVSQTFVTNYVDSSIAINNYYNGIDPCLPTILEGSIIWVDGFNFSNTKYKYRIGCQLDSADAGSFSITASDTTDRYTIIVADTNGVISSIDGTVGPVASIPNINPLSQILLATYLIPANSTSPQLLSNTNVYLNNAEWTGTSNISGINFAYGTNPYQGLYSTYAPSFLNQDYILYNGGTDYNLSSSSFLSFRLLIGTAFNINNAIEVYFVGVNGGIGYATVRSGQFGFNANTVNSYQLIVIPINEVIRYSPGNIFQKIQFVFQGSGGAVQLDNIILQSGGNTQSSTGVSSVNGQTNNVTTTTQWNTDSTWLYYLTNGVKTDSSFHVRDTLTAGTGGVEIVSVGRNHIINITGGSGSGISEVIAGNGLSNSNDSTINISDSMYSGINAKYPNLGRVKLLSNLAAKQLTGSNGVNITFFGDSWTVGSTITQPISNYFRDRITFGGAGYIGLDVTNNDPWAGRDVSRGTSGTWTDAASTNSPSLSSTTSTQVGAYKTIYAYVDTFSISYFGKTGGGTFRWNIDGGAWTSVNTSSLTGYQSISVGSGTRAYKTITIEVEVASTYGIELFGVTCEVRSNKGFMANCFGKSGSGAMDWKNISQSTLTAELGTYHQPSLINVMLGVNDMVNSTSAQFSLDLQAFIDKIQIAAPLAQIILATQPETGYTENIFPFADTIRSLAARNDLFLIDYNKILPYNSNAYDIWYTNKHPNDTGGVVMANIFTKEIPIYLDKPNQWDSVSGGIERKHGFARVNNATAAQLIAKSGTRQFAMSSYGGDWNYLMTSGAPMVFGTSDYNPLYFYTNNTYAASILPTGNFYIPNGQFSMGAAPDASAKFDVTSTTQGQLAPRMTDVQMRAISSPASGLFVTNTDSLNRIFIYTGSAWKGLAFTDEGGGGSSVGVDSIWRTVGQDSIKFSIGGRLRSIKDSTITGWGLSGNSISSGNYIGTNNGEALVFKSYGTFSGGIFQSQGNIYYGTLAGNGGTGGTFNTGVGYQALTSNSSGNYNSAFGIHSLFSNSSGNYNTAIGHQSLYTNNGGSYNIAIGSTALFYNTTGSNNTAIGAASLSANTTGNYSSAFGDRALTQSTTGYQNVAIGASSQDYTTTGFSNTSVGYRSLYYDSTGSENTVIGDNVLFNNKYGSKNIGIGVEAGAYYSTSTVVKKIDNSILIGYKVKTLADSLTNQIAIGHEAVTLGSNTTVIGNDNTIFTALRGTVGIGNTSSESSAQLDVKSTTKGALFPRMTTTEKNAISSPAEGLVVYDLTLHKLCVYTGSAWETITSL